MAGAGVRTYLVTFVLVPLSVLIGAGIYIEQMVWDADAATAAEAPAVPAPPHPGDDRAVSLSAEASGEENAAETRRFIEAANRSWREAYRSGDTRAMANIYTHDASLSLGGSEVLEGRADIVEYFAGQQRAGAGEPVLQTEQVVTIGEVAYEIGTYTMAGASGGDANGSVSGGRYFAIWKSQPDGGWLYHLGIWSRGDGVTEGP